MTVANTDGQSEQSKPASLKPEAGDGGSTLYQTRHRVKRTVGRLEIIDGGEPLPPDQHPRDFDELLVYMDDNAISATATSDGLVFTGGTEASRERVIACLNAEVWTECNLHRYLDGSLRDIDGRRYVHPKDRFL